MFERPHLEGKASVYVSDDTKKCVRKETFDDEDINIYVNSTVAAFIN
jgi:hypothetical protein